MLHIKQVVDIMIDGSANENRGAILLDPKGWLHFIRETGLPIDTSERVSYRGFVIASNDRLEARLFLAS